MKYLKAYAFPLIATFLLLLLGWFQFHWLGQVSVAQAQQLQQFMVRASESVAVDFDREISRAFNFFVVGVLEERDREAVLLQRQQAWLEQAPYPQMVSGVYLAKLEDGERNLFQLVADNNWKPVPWPMEMLPLKEDFKGHHTQNERQIPQCLVPELPALVAPPSKLVARLSRVGGRRSQLGMRRNGRFPGPDPTESRMGPGRFPRRWELPNMPNDVVMVTFDKNYLQNTLLPLLINQAFGTEPGLLPQYTVEPLPHREERRTREPPHPESRRIHQQRHGEDSSVSVVLLALHGFPEVAPKLEPRPLEDEADREWRVSEAFATYSELARHVYESALGGASNGAWQLTIKQHPHTVQAVIKHTRYKNLAVSFSILLLLGVSLILVYVSAARSRELADRQLEFVAGISHELLTPLAGVHGAGQNLAAGVVKDLDRVAQYGRMIEKESNRLTTMVRQVLVYASMKSDHGIRGAQQMDAHQLLLAGIEDCRAILAGFEEELQLPEDLGVIAGDAMALRRIVQNLVGNVVKYAADPPWIGLEARREGNRLFFFVHDHGPGIEPDDLKHLFEPFYRGKKQVASTIPGSGLGLCIVDHIVKAHGGQVSVTSRPGQGSSFCIKLPLVKHAGPLTSVDI